MQPDNGNWPRPPRASERPIGGVFMFEDRDGTLRYDLASAHADVDTVLAALHALITHELQQRGWEPPKH